MYYSYAIVVIGWYTMLKYLVLILVALTGCSPNPRTLLNTNTVAVINNLGMGGTAFSVHDHTSKRNYLITNAHVCVDEYFTMRFQYDKKLHEHTILAIFNNLDLCVIDFDMGHGLPIADSITIGERFTVLGFPYLAARQYSSGQVKSFTGTMYYSTAIVYPGNSGSAVLNTSNEVIGVVRALNVETNQAFFIPYTYVRVALNTVEERAKQ